MRFSSSTKFYSAQIAMALNYMHVKGIVYGDLKAENILIDNYGYAKVTDFGASRMLNGKKSIEAFAGTPDYLGKKHFNQLPKCSPPKRSPGCPTGGLSAS